MKRHLISPVILGTTLLVGACPALAADDKQWESGEEVYNKVCGHCHEAGIGPVIKGRSLPEVYIQAIVRNGFRAMPAFRSSFIDDSSLESVSSFISTSAANKPADEE